MNHRKVWPVWCPAVDLTPPHYYGRHRMFAVLTWGDPALPFERRNTR